MSKAAPGTLDDLEAVRSIASALENFSKVDQQRILRWAQEKIGLAQCAAIHPTSTDRAEQEEKPQSPASFSTAGTDIKTFVEKKNPSSDAQFTATVAYYHRFEAPAGMQKPSITAEDLQDACRKVGRDRLKRPAQTLVNAHQQGLLDRGDRGSYTLSTVGENLVAVALPAEGAKSRIRSNGRSSNSKRKKSVLKSKNARKTRR